MVAEATKIEVKQSYSMGEDITVQFGYWEDGQFILDECNHAGAESEEMDFVAYTSFEGMQVPDDSRTEEVLVCDKENCKAWFNDLDNSWEQQS